MTIKINDDYRIERDKLNWILQERKITDPKHRLSKSDTPQEKWVDIGYFGRIEHLVNRLLDDALFKAEANTLDDFKNALFHIEKRLTMRLMESL